MVKLTIEVENIGVVIATYNTIRIYTSDTETGTYIPLTTVSLIAGVSTYYYNHVLGTPDTWYKSDYYHTGTGAFSSMSEADHGEAALYHPITYPEEYAFTAAEDGIIRTIRRFIGDLKGLKRLYLDDDDEFCSSIHEDAHVVDMGEKGWPVYISVNAVEYTSLADPIVQGYQYLTFSGTLNSGVENDVINIWFYTFKFSDREVYEAYGDSMRPPGLSSTMVTQDHLILQAAINLLENMTSEDMVDDGASIRDDQTSYDPTPGLRERARTIERLQKRLDALIKESIHSVLLGLEGVQMD